MSKIKTGIFGNFSVSGGKFYTFKTGIPGGPGCQALIGPGGHVTKLY